VLEGAVPHIYGARTDSPGTGHTHHEMQCLQFEFQPWSPRVSQTKVCCRHTILRVLSQNSLIPYVADSQTSHNGDL
jgi:hypothetical protein